MKISMTRHQKSIIENALRVALRAYEQDAKNCAGAGSDEPGAFVTTQGAERLRKQFERQARDVRAVTALLDYADDIDLDVDDDLMREDAQSDDEIYDAMTDLGIKIAQ